METNTKLIVEAAIYAPLKNVWDCWTEPEHITQWNFATSDWKCPVAQIDLRSGGKFSYRMEAVDGSVGFDFSGEFTKVEALKKLEYRIDDGRYVSVEFYDLGNEVHLVEKFEAENEHPAEMQQAGWQAILNNFKTYVESIS